MCGFALLFAAAAADVVDTAAVHYRTHRVDAMRWRQYKIAKYSFELRGFFLVNNSSIDCVNLLLLLLPQLFSSFILHMLKLFIKLYCTKC